MKRILVLAIFSIILSLGAVSPVYADQVVSCQPVYGGGSSCTSGQLKINKTVQNPQTGVFVDNLGVNDPKFAPNDIVTFQLTVTNNTNGVVSNARVSDIFPQFVKFRSGSGAFDANTNTLSFGMADLPAGGSQTFTLTGTIVDAASLPANQAITCVTNTAQVRVNTIMDQDTAGLCIQKPMQNIPNNAIITTTPSVTRGGLPVFPAPTARNIPKTPPTGPEVLYLLAALPGGLLGQFLRKSAHGKTSSKNKSA